LYRRLIILLLLQIHPDPHFNAEAAAKELRDSMKGLGRLTSVIYLSF